MKEAALYIGLGWLANLIAWKAGPIQSLKSWLRLEGDEDHAGRLRGFVAKLLSCPVCAGFWVGLAYHLATDGFELQALPFAAFISVLSLALEYVRALPLPFS